MKNTLITLKQLDKQFAALKQQRAYLMPRYGWVRTLRKALGMTISQLAKRLRVDPSRVVKIETSEVQGAVTLQTMQAVAEALNCKFVYSFIPNSTLQETIMARAEKIVTMQLHRVSHNMDLEAQSVNKEWLEHQKKEEVEELLKKSWRHLWEEK